MFHGRSADVLLTQLCEGQRATACPPVKVDDALRHPSFVE